MLRHLAWAILSIGRLTVPMGWISCKLGEIATRELAASRGKSLLTYEPPRRSLNRGESADKRMAKSVNLLHAHSSG